MPCGSKVCFILIVVGVNAIPYTVNKNIPIYQQSEDREEIYPDAADEGILNDHNLKRPLS